MMKLPPFISVGSENTRRSEGEFKPHFPADQRPALSSNRDEAAAEFVDGIVVELHLDPCVA